MADRKRFGLVPSAGPLTPTGLRITTRRFGETRGGAWNTTQEGMQHVENSYWNKTLSNRVSRRRALKVGGATAAAAAFLAACGGDDDDGGTTGGTTGGGSTGGGATASGLLTTIEDTYSQAVRGGELVDFMTAEPRSTDPVNPQANLNTLIGETMNTLLTEVPGHLEASAYALTGAVAESWEATPDQITFKIRPGAKWHNIDPVNGREVDSEDVLWSLGHHQELAPLSPLVWNATSGGGFAGTPTAPDSMTVVVPLSEPLAYAANWFASFGSVTGQMLMYPKEAGGAYDPRQAVIGTGPFFVSQHENSVDFTVTRNPEYWDQDHALIDSIHLPILPEYATRNAQLEAGAVHYARDNTNIARATDILTLKKDRPDLLLRQQETRPAASVMTFGTQGENVPYFDERVRRAISMSFDRDLSIDVTYNSEEFAAAGLPVESYHNSHLAYRDSFFGGGFWLDPQSSEFGENAKNLQFNPDEAKKLLTAAGYPDGFEVKFGYPNAPQFDRGNVVEPFFFYLQQIGLTVIDNGYEDYTQGYIPLDRDASGVFEGMGYHSVTGGITSTISPISALVAEHHPASGVTFHGYSEGGGTGKTGDPVVIEILNKAKFETDTNAARELAIEAQRHLAGKMWSLNEPGTASAFALAWPAVKNLGVWNSAAVVWRKYQIWLDKTQKPFA